MRPSLALAIGAAFSIPLGLALVLAPAQMLSAFGLANLPDIALVQARDTGVVLTGVGIIDWLGRGAVGAPLKGLLWGNLFIRVAAMAVNSWEFATGQIPQSAAAVFPLALAGNIALIIVFASALRQAGTAMPVGERTG